MLQCSPELVEFEEEKHADDVHECCVKLEIDFCGTNVVSSAQDSFHDECHTEGIEYAVLFWNTLLLVVDSKASTMLRILFIQSLPEILLRQACKFKNIDLYHH